MGYSVRHSPNPMNKIWMCLRGKYCEEFVAQYRKVISGEADITLSYMNYIKSQS
jgi:hypothetical protein